MFNDLPRYSDGEYASAREVSDTKSNPPQYHEAAATSSQHGQISGQTYLEKTTANVAEAAAKAYQPSSFTVHATETENLVLLDEATALPVYYIDSTTALSKTYLRKGDSTSGPIVSLSKVAGPFVKEMLTEYTSKTESGTKETDLQAQGKFNITWEFIFRKHMYSWSLHKGVRTLKQLDGQALVATYDTGRSLKIEASFLHMTHVIISTVSSIALYARLSGERRQRALNSVTGKSSSPLIVSGLLL